jgi:hypothetical protein
MRTAFWLRRPRPQQPLLQSLLRKRSSPFLPNHIVPLRRFANPPVPIRRILRDALSGDPFHSVGIAMQISYANEIGPNVPALTDSDTVSSW